MIDDVYRSGYQERQLDLAKILDALGHQYERSTVDEIAQEAACLYYRLKGRFVTEYYHRKKG